MPFGNERSDHGHSMSQGEIATVGIELKRMVDAEVDRADPDFAQLFSGICDAVCGVKIATGKVVGLEIVNIPASGSMILVHTLCNHTLRRFDELPFAEAS
jgi:hypothetical protein